MNFVRREEGRVIIRQVPIALLLAGAVLSLPMLGYGLFAPPGVDGRIFCLIFGAAMLWLFLEFVGTRERIVVDRAAGTLTRTVTGVFRRRRERIDLAGATELSVEVEWVPSVRGSGRREHLYLHTAQGKARLNSPEKVYLDAGRLGRLVSDATGIPLRA